MLLGQIGYGMLSFCIIKYVWLNDTLTSVIASGQIKSRAQYVNFKNSSLDDLQRRGCLRIKTSRHQIMLKLT